VRIINSFTLLHCVILGILVESFRLIKWFWKLLIFFLIFAQQTPRHPSQSQKSQLDPRSEVETPSRQPRMGEVLLSENGSPIEIGRFLWFDFSFLWIGFSNQLPLSTISSNIPPSSSSQSTNHLTCLVTPSKPYSSHSSTSSSPPQSILQLQLTNGSQATLNPDTDMVQNSLSLSLFMIWFKNIELFVRGGKGGCEISDEFSHGKDAENDGATLKNKNKKQE